MATYDADIGLTTNLEPGNVIAAAEKINKEIEAVFKHADGIDLSKNTKNALDTLEDLRIRLQDTLTEVHELADTRVPSHDYEVMLDIVNNANRQLAESSNKIDTLIDKQQELAQQKVPTQEYTDLKNEISYSESALVGLQTSMQKLIDKTKTGKPRSEKFKKMKADAEALEIKITELKQKLQELEDTGKNFESGRNTPEFADIENQIEQENATYEAIKRTRATAQAKLSAMEKTGADTVSGLKSVQAKELLQSLNEITNEATVATEAVRGFGEIPGIDKANQSIGRLMSIMTRFLQLNDSAEGEDSEEEGTPGLLSRIASTAGKAVTNLAKLTFGGPLKLVKASLTTIANLAKKAASNLAKMASRTIINGLKSLGKSIAGVSKHSSRNNNVLNKGFKTFIKYAFGVRSFFFLFRKIRSAIIDGFGDLAQVHEPFNRAMSSIMTSLNYLRNSFASAFAPIIETVAPALTTFINLVAEAVSKVGMLIAALTGKEFVRALPVQKDYAESVNSTAKNAKSASKATSEQNKKTKELQRTLAGFDDVEILHEDKDTDTGPDADSSGIASPGFGSGAIDSAVKSFAGKLIEAWKGADFYEIGRIAGEKLKAALESIPWDKIKDVLRRFSSVIATFLNGFLEVPGLFTEIGKTIAEVINSVFELFNTFATKFHWDSLGKALRDGIIGIADNIDWNLISDTFSKLGRGIADFINAGFTDPEVWTKIFTTISNVFNSLLLGITELIENTDWDSLIDSIGTGLTNGINNFNWAGLGNLLIRVINGAINLAYKFVTSFDFKEFGRRIGTGISNAINKIDWAKGATTVAKVISGLFAALNGFIETVDWKELGSKVVTTIATFFNELDWSEFGEFISNCFKALWSFFVGVIETIDWAEVPNKILTIIADILSGFDWSGTVQTLGELLGAEFLALVKIGSKLLKIMVDVGKDIIAGGLKGIDDALMNISDWIIDHIFKPFIDGFKSAFGIQSPSKEMKPLGENIIQGMLEGILNIMSSIGTWITDNIFTPIVNGIKNAFGLGEAASKLFEIGSNLMTDMQDGISNVTSKMSSWVKTNITDRVSGFVKSHWGISGSSSSVFNKFGTNLIDGLKSGLSTKTNSSQSWLKTDIANKISNTFKNALGIGTSSGTFNKFGNTMMTDLQSGINNKKSSVLSTITNLKSSISTSFSSGSWSSIGSSIISGVQTGLYSGWSSLTSTARSVALSAYTSARLALGIHSPSKKFMYIGNMITAGMSNGIASTGSRVLDAMSNITGDLIEDAENTNPELVLDGSLSDLNSSLDTILSGFSDKVVTEFSMLISTLEKLGESLQLAIPGIALGQVAPYSVGNSSNSSANTISKLIDIVRELSADMVTRDDLQEIIEAINDKDFDVRLGDEQVARSANRGNKKLNRRYNPVVL